MVMNTIAILYPGDMGSHIAQALVDQKFHVVSYLEGRSDATKKIAAQIGIETLASLSEVASVASFVISLVPPNAVKPVAAAYIEAASKVNNPGRFVDMNAKSTITANELSAMFIAAGLPFTNACIIGRAAYVKAEGTIYTSGQQSAELEALLGRVFRVIFLGSEVSAATAFKMCFAGFNKTIMAAIFEIAAAANKFEITDRLFAEITEKMPGLIEDMSKLIGTYPKHLARRKQEMEELVKMLDSVALPNHIANAAANTFAEVEKRKNLDDYKDRPETSFLTLIKALHL